MPGLQAHPSTNLRGYPLSGSRPAGSASLPSQPREGRPAGSAPFPSQQRDGRQLSPRGAAFPPGGFGATIGSPRLGGACAAPHTETRAGRAAASAASLREGAQRGPAVSHPGLTGAPKKDFSSPDAADGAAVGNSRASRVAAVEKYLARNHVQRDIADEFHKLTLDQQLDIIARGDVCHAGNPMAALLYRIKDVQTGDRADDKCMRSPVVALYPEEFDGHIRVWLTVGAPSLRRESGKYYYEVNFGRGLENPQVGWATDEFNPAAGVGGDRASWAADGKRHRFWHNGAYSVKWPESWRDGDTIGVAIDLDEGNLVFVHNGKWALPAPFALPRGASIFPAISSKGEFVFRFTKGTFQYNPPDPSYKPLMDDEEAESTFGCRGSFARPVPRSKPFHISESPRPVGRKMYWDTPNQQSLVDQVVFGRDMDFSGDTQFDETYLEMFAGCYGMRSQASDINITHPAKSGMRHFPNLPHRHSNIHEVMFGHNTVGPEVPQKGKAQFRQMYNGAFGKPSDERPDLEHPEHWGKRHVAPMEHAPEHKHERHHFQAKRSDVLGGAGGRGR